MGERECHRAEQPHFRGALDERLDLEQVAGRTLDAEHAYLARTAARSQRTDCRAVAKSAAASYDVPLLAGEKVDHPSQTESGDGWPLQQAEHDRGQGQALLGIEAAV